MTKKMPGWEQWEKDVQDRLGLSATICSGNQFQDQGDATDRSNPHDVPFRLLVDCKFTEKGSFSVKRQTMQQWILKGVERGKMAVMAIRVWPHGHSHEADYVVLSFDDFEELVEKARAWADMPRCPNAGSICNCTGECRVPVSQRKSFREAARTFSTIISSEPRCPNQGGPCNCTGACLPKPTMGASPSGLVDRTWLERREHRYADGPDFSGFNLGLV